MLDVRHRPSRLCFSHFATRTVDNTVDLYATMPAIRQESHFCPTSAAFDVPVGMEKPEWLGDPMVKKKFKDIFIRFGTIHERDGRTDGHTDRQTLHADMCRAYASHRAA